MALPPTALAARILGTTFLLYALLVATHEGEFWPFSIFPMFSQAGKPWTRAVVRVLPEEAVPVPWTAYDPAHLPGTPYPLAPRGISAIDLSNLITNTRRWDATPVAVLRTLLRADQHDQALLVVRARGVIAPQDTVHITWEPFAVLTPDTTWLHPRLTRPME
jgi:hypothetical protein